ncbi:MAG: NAD(P)/FAD-dependent oxidoreductase [Gammaproteobacteria bacterium]|nr:NAD(P)/FAD-dependent oxidoreductase [Gammaproteobacteria bacterium]
MDIDSIVIGAGVVGLAIARTLASSGREVIVLERHKHIGQETSSRNSEVIHAGIYYPKDSLKAKLCVRGKQLLYDFCESHHVEHRRLGKLIVATDDEQAGNLEKIFQKALANGVDDVRYLDRQTLLEMEPELNAVRAIHSPSTGIINSHELMLAYQGELENHGGTVALDSPVLSGEVIEGGFRLSVGGEEPSTISCRELINSAGLGAQSLAASVRGIPADSIPQRYLSRGCYFTLSGKAPFDHLIYPMPNNVGLGVHLTIDLQGQARFGPDTQWIDEIDYTVDPRRGDAFYAAVRDYFPGLQDGKLEPAYAGIRPKISGPGEDAADFVIQGPAVHGVPGWIALYGIESPGLTSSIAIAEKVLEELDQTL